MLLQLSLLFALYLSLDFSNPMMPGAVGFGPGESVEARQGDRLRGAEVTEAPSMVPTIGRVPPFAPPPTVSRRPAPAVSYVWRAFLHRSYPCLSDSTSLSEDA